MSIKYSEDHEWVDAKEDDLVVIGITDFAQEQLGDLVYVCLLYTSPSPRDRG